MHRELNGCISVMSSGESTAAAATELRASGKQVCERVVRMCEMIEAEMNNYEPCAFTARILDSTCALSTRLLASFSHSCEAYEIDAAIGENDVIESARLIYDAVRDLRSAVWMIPTAAGADDGGGGGAQDAHDAFADFDEEYEETLRQQHERSSLYCVDEAIGEMDEKTHGGALTDEQREKINQELSSLRKEKTNFDREVIFQFLFEVFRITMFFLFYQWFHLFRFVFEYKSKNHKLQTRCSNGTISRTRLSCWPNK